MPIMENFSLQREKIISQGLHNFEILDINTKTTTKDNEDITYLTFSLKEIDTDNIFNNLLSVPLNFKNYKFVENSRIGKLLSKFEIRIPENEYLTHTDLNSLIGNKFSAIVVYDKQFSKIDEKTITFHLLDE
jgi:hypothetical protein